MSDYLQLVERKLAMTAPTGITERVDMPAGLFPHQAALTAWALRRGRAAIFADTGLGKMRMELVWADVVNKHTGRPIMGSEGYVAVGMGRRFVGVQLKASYFRQAVGNLEAATVKTADLFLAA